MSLDDLVTTLKHMAGKHSQKRHGKVGGSSSGSSALKGLDTKMPSKVYKEVKLEDILFEGSKVAAGWPISEVDAIKVLEGMIATYPDTGQGAVNYIAGLIDYKDSSTGLEFRYVSFNYEAPAGKLWVELTIQDSEGIKVGSADRMFNLKTREIEHSSMALSDSIQASGFGTRFYYESERAYKQAGFNKIILEANMTVGGYAWARMGYSPVDSQDMSRQIRFLKANYKEKHGKPLPELQVPKTMWDLAAFTDTDGERMGKAQLLGSSWYAVKMLNDADPGYLAGLDYYKLKDVKVD